jgi:retron-type reverse transcriptase
MSERTDLFLKTLLDHGEWQHSLQVFASKPNVRKRFGIMRVERSDLSLADLFYNEARFHLIFKKGVLTESFETGLAKEIFLPSPTKADPHKRRKLHSFKIFDTFIYEHTARVLSELVNPFLAESNFGYRKGTGDTVAVEKVLAHLKARSEPLWVVRRDIKDFVPTFPHTLLVEGLSEKLHLSPHSVSFLYKLLRFPFLSEEGAICSNIAGSPTGTSLQHSLGNFLLHEIDRSLEERCPLYQRFGDDILIISDSFASARDAAAYLDAAIEAKQINVNVKKSKHLVLHPSSELIPEPFRRAKAFDYLGRTICENGLVIRPKEKFLPLKHFIVHYLGQTERILRGEDLEKRLQGLCDAMRMLLTEDTYGTGAAIQAALRRIDSPGHIRDFDLWIALTLLKFALRRPFKKTLLRKVPLKKLRTLGLPSLIHIKNEYAFSK